MIVLVTGHKGFLGSNMVKFLKSKNREVRTTDGDLRDYKVALNATYGVDWVMSFAANMGGIGFFSEQNYYPVMDNFLIDINILKACEEHKVKRLFYPSSACAYNVDLMNQGVPLCEDLLDGPAKPDQMYGWEKLTMLKLMANSPVDCRVGVLHTIYGDGQEFMGPKAKFPPQMAYKGIVAAKTGRISVWGDGTQTRTFLHVDDAMKKIYAMMNTKKNHGPLNIGAWKEVSVNEIVELVCSILDIKPEVTHDLTKPVGPTRRICSNVKYDSKYTIREDVTLRDGFTRLINYIKAHESARHSDSRIRSRRLRSRS